MIKAIIFDFDGVIVDSETKKFEVLKGLITPLGLALEQDSFKDMIGKKTGAFLSEKFPNLNNSELQAIVKLRREKEFSDPRRVLIPGIKELLKYIKAKGVKIVITTGTARELVEKILKDHSISHFFDLIVAGDDFEQSKPSPECYEKTLSELGLTSSDVLIIEDSVAGISASKSANCKVFGIMTYFGKEELHEADNVFLDHSGILEYLKKEKMI